MANANMSQDLLQMMAELSDDSDIMGAISSVAPMRGGGRSSTGGTIRMGATSTGGSYPAAAAEYLGQEQASSEAADDGTRAPEAGRQYALAYMNDPEWKHWDKMRAGAVNNMKGGGGFWGWATGGRYNNALAGEASHADYMARQIEKRYLDMATVRAAQQEQFPGAPTETEVYNPQTGQFSNRYLGNRGTVRDVPTPRPVRQMVTETGRITMATPGPGARDMVEVTGDGVTDSAETESGPFAGGVASAHTPMPVVRDAKTVAANRETQSRVDENAAQEARALAEAKKALAEAGKAGIIEMSPGATPYDAATGRYGKQAPLTPAQAKAGADPARERTYDEDLREVQGLTRGMYSSTASVATGAIPREVESAMRARGWDVKTKGRISGSDTSAMPSAGTTPETAIEWEFDENGQPRRKRR